MDKKVIIIGSGLGGLVCGHILSRKGMKVCILERQNHPGGCIQNFKRRNVPFDTGLHYIGGIGEGEPLHDAFKELGLLDLPWHRLDDDCFDEITVAGRTYRFAHGYDNFVETLSRDFPHEREGLEKYVKMLQTDDEEWLQTTNAYDYLTSIIHDPLLISVISGASIKMELRRETLPLFVFAHGNGSFIQSSWRLEGNGDMVVNHLLDDIKANGGQLICNAEVSEIVEFNGRAHHVVCTDGRAYEADLIISNAHPSATLSLVKESEKIRNIFRKRINRIENTFGMFTAQLVLKPGALRYFNHNKFIYEMDDVWSFHEHQSDHVTGVMVSCPTPADGGDDAMVLDLLTPMRWSEVEPWKDLPYGKRGPEYKALKDRYTAECIRLAETRIPGLSSMVETVYSSTPLTYASYNHAPEGSAYGMRKDYSNPLGTIISPLTPIPNLYLTGQSLMLHGIHGVVMTAKYTCMGVLGNSEIKENKK